MARYGVLDVALPLSIVFVVGTFAASSFWWYDIGEVLFPGCAQYIDDALPPASDHVLASSREIAAKSNILECSLSSLCC